MVSDLLPLRASGLAVRRGGKRLIGPVDLELGPEGITVVIGPNGAGKTSLLTALHGILKPSAGRVDWACGAEVARARQAFVFQTPVMLRRSVVENLLYPLRLARVPNGEARAQARGWCARIGLETAGDRSAKLLSRGEKQKLALARALIGRPEMVFLDEPCASLDGRSTREIEEMLRTAAADGTRLVMATHDMGQARRLATEVLFLLHGRIHEAGPAPCFFDAPETAQARAFLAGDIVE